MKQDIQKQVSSISNQLWDGFQEYRVDLDPIIQANGMDPDGFWGELHGMLFPQPEKPKAGDASATSGATGLQKAFVTGKGFVEAFGQGTADLVGGAAGFFNAKGEMTPYGRLAQERRVLADRLENLDEWIANDAEPTRQGKGFGLGGPGVFSPHGNADPFREAAQAKKEEARKSGRDSEAQKILQRIQEIDGEIEGLPEAEQGVERYPLIDFRDAMDKAGSAIRAAFTDRSYEQELERTKGARDAVARNEDLSKWQGRGEVGGATAEFLVGGTGKMVGKGAEIATRGMTKVGSKKLAESFLGRTAAMAAGVGAERGLKTSGDLEQTAFGMALAPVYVITGKVGERFASAQLAQKIYNLSSRAGATGKLLTEGAVMEALSQTEIAALKQIGWTPADVAEAPNFVSGAFKAAHAIATKDWDAFEAAKAEMAESGEHMLTNMVAMGSIGAVAPHVTPFYARNNRELWREQMQKRRQREIDRLKKKDPDKGKAVETALAKIQPEVVEAVEFEGFHMKRNGRFTKPGWGSFEVVVEGETVTLRARKPHGETFELTGPQALDFVGDIARSARARNLESRLLLNFKGVTESGDVKGVHRISTPEMKGRITVDAEGKIKVQKDGSNDWVIWEPKLELREPGVVDPQLRQTLIAMDQAFGSQLTPNGRMLLDRVQAYVDQAPPGDAQVVQDMARILGDHQIMSLAARNPDLFVDKLAEMANGGTAQDMVGRFARELQAQEKYEADMRQQEAQAKKEGAKRAEKIRAEAKKKLQDKQKPEGDELAELEAKVKEMAEKGEDVPDEVMARYTELKESSGKRKAPEKKPISDKARDFLEKTGRKAEESAEQGEQAQRKKVATEEGPADWTYRQQGFKKGETPYMVGLLKQVRAEHGEKPLRTGKASSKSMGFVPPQMRVFSELIDTVGRRFRRPKKETQKLGEELLNDRQGEIDETFLRIQAEIGKMVREIPSVDQRQDLTAFLEQTGNINKPGDTFEAVQGRMTPEMKKWAKWLREKFDESHRELVDSGYLEEGQYWENYVAHRYDVKTREQLLKTWDNLNKNIPHDKKREYATYEQAMREGGLIPKNYDAATILMDMRNRIAVAKANKRLIEKIKEIKGPDGNALAIEGDAPPGYIEFNHREFAKKGGGYWKVHPELQKPLRKLLDNGIDAGDNVVLKAMFDLSRVMKTHQLGWSLFHAGALVESFMQSAKFGSNMLRHGAGFRRAWKMAGALKAADPATVEIAADAAKHGLSVHGNSDVQRGWYQQKLENWIQRLDRSGNAGPAMILKGYSKAKKGFDAFLWDYVHTGFKLLRYTEEVGRQMHKNADRIAKDPAVLKRIKEQVSARVNDEFGGQNWGRWHKMLGTQKAVDMAHLMMLSPDWTTSVWKTGAGDLAAVAETLGVKRAKNEFTLDMRRRHLLQTAIVMPLVTQFYQLISAFGGQIPVLGEGLEWLGISMDDEERERWEAEGGDAFVPRRIIETYNRTGSVMRAFDAASTVDVGYNKDGSKRVAQPFKQIREFLHNPVTDLEGFVAMAGAKANPVVRELYKQIAGEDLFSDFPADWEDTAYREVAASEKARLRIASLIGNTFGPFSLSGNSYSLTLPERKGMTRYKLEKSAREMFAVYAGGGDFTIEGQKASREELLQEIRNLVRDAKRNKVDDYKQPIRRALGQLRNGYLTEIAKAVSEQDADKLEKLMKSYAMLNPGTVDPVNKLHREFKKLWADDDLHYTEDEIKVLIKRLDRGLRARKNPQLQKALGAIDRESDRDTRQWTQERGF